MCHLYYGESLRPFLTKYVEVKVTDSRWFCHFFISSYDLWRGLDTLKTKEISCDYSLEKGDKSPRSDGYDMSAFIKNAPVPQPHVTTAVLEPVKTTTPGHVTGSEPKTSSPEPTTTILMSGTQNMAISAEPAPNSTLKDDVLKTVQQPTSVRWVWKLVVLLTVCGVTVGSVLLVLSVLCTKQAPANSNHTKSQDSNLDAVDPQNPTSSNMAASGSACYSLITSAPAIKGTSMIDRKELKREVQYDSSTYHLYATIQDDPLPASVVDSYL
ncbi:uncharacterized protein LOC117382608 [Periophthalmus magnuspinnatus]|uniref:uncharacterized protein LOC117382608 n=1 Tax=Periophthalmus magnuspinnatus TaxID=409849 RepID=UPI00243654BC|nr:uncharacterized protein LOC117382608 [Periophthalmus magnuspinnatus]